MRRWFAVALLAGCGASVDNANDPPDAKTDAPAGTDDARVDAPPPVDARVCAGGDSHAAAPDGSCVVFFNQPKTFADAQAACIAFGSQLAILTDAQRESTARALVGTLDVFIGLTDQVQENVFVWVDGTPIQFANFATGEPNNANGAFQEDCIIIAGSRAGWDDRPCAPDPATTTPGMYPYLCLF